VTDAVREKLLTPKRLTMILEALIDRQAAKDASVISRRSALEAEIGCQSALKRDPVSASKRDPLCLCDGRARRRCAEPLA
jgi:hypothetical protein